MLLRVISIGYPFSEFVVSGLKDIINRKIKYSYKGLVLIHSSKVPNDEWHLDCSIKSYKKGLKHLNNIALSSKGLSKPVLGSIVGAAIITDIYKNHDSQWTLYDRFQLVLNSPIKLNKPFCCNAETGIFFLKKELLNSFSETDMELIKSLYQYSKNSLGIKYVLT